EAVDRMSGVSPRRKRADDAAVGLSQARVVVGAPHGVREHVVGVPDLRRAERRQGHAPGVVEVREAVGIAREPAVGLLDLLRRGIAADAERAVEIRHRRLLARLCSRLHWSIRPWSPDRRTSGTCQPRNSAGRVYCGYSSPPPSAVEKLSSPPEPSLSAPGNSLAIPSTRTIAGRSPFERTYGPTEIASELSSVTIRSSKPSKRAESTVIRSSAASSSTTRCVSWRP